LAAAAAGAGALGATRGGGVGALGAAIGGPAFAGWNVCGDIGLAATDGGGPGGLGGGGVGAKVLAAGALFPGTLFLGPALPMALLPGRCGDVFSFAAAGGAPTLGAPVPGGGNVAVDGVTVDGGVVSLAAGVPNFGAPEVPVAAVPLGGVGGTSFAAGGVAPGVVLDLGIPLGAVAPGARVGAVVTTPLAAGSGCPFMPGNG
jgi:hypothetical protein